MRNPDVGSAKGSWYTSYSEAVKFTRRSLQTDNSTTISYLDSDGPGPAVLFLHGLAGSATEFLPTAQALPGRRVIVMDQRGHGHSTRLPSNTSRAAFVHDCVRVIEFACGSAVILVGQSMGAHTAMLVAAARPDLVQGLVLLEGGASEGDNLENQKLGDFFRSWPAPFQNREAARASLGDGPLERAWVEDLEERDDGLYPRFDPDVMVSTMDSVAAPRWQEWERVTAPTLVIYAQNGIFTEEQKTEFVNCGQHVVRADLAGASHDAHLDTFDPWIEALRDFLDGR